MLTSCFSGACGRAVLNLARISMGSVPEITCTKRKKALAECIKIDLLIANLDIISLVGIIGKIRKLNFSMNISIDCKN